MRAILEWAHSVLCEKQLVKYALIKTNRQVFSIVSMCRVLSVKPSSYYDWSSRDISEQQIHRNHCELLVKAAHSESKERYGYERLHATLTEQGHDITYIWTNEGWLYLAGVKDLYIKELVGYAIIKRMTADLVCKVLNMAIKNKRPSKGLVVHSKIGSQYVATRTIRSSSSLTLQAQWALKVTALTTHP